MNVVLGKAWGLSILLMLLVTACDVHVDYDRKPPEMAFEMGLEAEDLMFDIKDALDLDRDSTREHSGVDNYCTLPFPKTWNPISKVAQILRDVSKNPVKGFRPDAGLDINLEALGEHRSLETLFEEIRHWLALNGFVVSEDVPDERTKGWAIRAFNTADQMSFEAWGRDQDLKLRFDAACIEANRR